MNRIKKNINRLLIKLIIIFFILSIAVSAFFTVTLYISEKESLYQTAVNNYSNVKFDITQNYTLNVGWSTYSNSDNDKSIIVKDENNKIYVDTENRAAITYVDENRCYTFGYIDKTALRNSIPEEVYKKIEDYLNSPPVDESYYELVCSEYIEKDSNEVIPIRVSVVLTEETHTWNVQDTLIEDFKLNVTDSEKGPSNDVICRKSGLMYRNTIPKDLIFPADNDILTNFEPPEYADEKDLFYEKNFNYVYFKSETVYVITSEINVVNSNNNISNYVSVDGLLNPYVITYKETFNVFESCKRMIFLSVSYTFILFFIVGAIVIYFSLSTLKKQYKQEEELRDYTNTLAHNLKTPLFIISGNAEILKELAQGSKEENYINVIVEKSSEMNMLIHDTIELSKLDSITLEPHFEPIRLAVLIKDTVSNYPEYNKYINLNIDESAAVNADKDLLILAIRNLVENAIKNIGSNNLIFITADKDCFIIENSFKRTDEMHSKSSLVQNPNSLCSNGIGLKIVDKVIKLHGFKYKITQTDNSFIFKIIF